MYNYKELSDMLGDELILSGVNENKETVILQRHTKTEVASYTQQKNGWIRINVYHEDGTEEETYEH